MSLEARLEAASSEFQKLQNDIQKAIDTRTMLDGQLSENEIVKQEFEHLKEENTVYKLIGPVLVKQDQSEAKSNVEKRIEYIKAEIKRNEALLADLGAKADKKKESIMSLQTQFQQERQKVTAAAS